MNFTFQELLRKEFNDYLAKNPKLSLRSFAKHLSLAPSTLHQYLNGKYPPSSKNLHKISETLSWSEDTLNHFIDFYSTPGVRSEAKHLFYSESSAGLVDEIILKIIALKSNANTKYSIENLLKVLKLEPQQRGLLMSKLNLMRDFGLIEWDGAKVKIRSELKIISKGIPEGKFLDFQIKSLDHLKKALTQTDKDERLFLASTLYVNKKDLPALAVEFNKFVKKLKRYSQPGDDSVPHQIIIAAHPFPQAAERED